MEKIESPFKNKPEKLEGYIYFLRLLMIACFWVVAPIILFSLLSRTPDWGQAAIILCTAIFIASYFVRRGFKRKLNLFEESIGELKKKYVNAYEQEIIKYKNDIALNLKEIEVVGYPAEIDKIFPDLTDDRLIRGFADKAPARDIAANVYIEALKANHKLNGIQAAEIINFNGKRKLNSFYSFLSLISALIFISGLNMGVHYVPSDTLAENAKIIALIWVVFLFFPIILPSKKSRKIVKIHTIGQKIFFLFLVAPFLYFFASGLILPTLLGFYLTKDSPSIVKEVRAYGYKEHPDRRYSQAKLTSESYLNETILQFDSSKVKFPSNQFKVELKGRESKYGMIIDQYKIIKENEQRTD